VNILVAGGGLAGLSAAIALANKRFTVTLVEPQQVRAGASISITNRGVDALEELGVLDAVLQRSVTIDGADSLFTTIRDGAGNVLPVPPPPPRVDTRLPSAVILLREELMALLYTAASDAGVTLLIGERVEKIDHYPHHVCAHFSSGNHAQFDLLVGADGLHSALRTLLFPDAPQPSYTGHMSFRWVLPNGPEGDTGFYMLPDSTTLTTLRLRDGQTYLATGIDMPMERLSQPEARQIVRDILGRFDAPFPRALRTQLDENQRIIVLPYSWLLMPTPWHDGRVIMIGDAVHTTTAHMASGGSLALEDGVVLAQELAGEGTLTDRLGRYAARRVGRSSDVVTVSVELLRLQQASAPPAASASLRAKAVAALRAPY
jgi:2-polyprenyl-6-methoxyphenol hydroxylase-like FAD-dependent oxidoreductase